LRRETQGSCLKLPKAAVLKDTQFPYVKSPEVTLLKGAQLPVLEPRHRRGGPQGSTEPLAPRSGIS
jgi:hypothetical protein